MRSAVRLYLVAWIPVELQIGTPHSLCVLDMSHSLSQKLQGLPGHQGILCYLVVFPTLARAQSCLAAGVCYAC
jgi:hypothetical protein